MLDDIKAKYRNRTPQILGHKNYRKAAVLIPLMRNQGEISILFQVRGHNLRHQPGEICFPGGRIEPTDPSEEAAAVRETCEELGIGESDINVLGPSDIFVATHSIVYPFLGQLREGVTLNPGDLEVHELFTVPLDFLLQYKPELHLVPIEMKPAADFPFDSIPGGEYYKWRKANIPEYFYRYEDKVIWGMTARILTDFLDRIR